MSERQGVNVSATVWLPYAEPQLHLREMKLYSDHYDSTITLLVLPRWQRHGARANLMMTSEWRSELFRRSETFGM